MPQLSLRQDIIAFLLNVPNMSDKDGRKALLNSVLDAALLHQIDWHGPSAVFFPNLLDLLLKYDAAGQALAALLEAAKGWVGLDKQAHCDDLLTRLRAAPSPELALRAVTGPRHLPPLDAHFVNRTRELAQLLTDLRPGTVVTLCGPGGMGKSALAAQAAHRIEPERFPDGVFFHTFYGQPDPNLALEALALAFGVEPKPTPAIAAQQALAGKRALLMLDGAEEAADLRPVLNARGQCGVLITTRRKRDALDARQDLTPLNAAHAAELLSAWGQLPTDDPAVRRICQLVGGLPLAVRLIGHYLDETNETAAEYLDWLEAQPFEALHRGQHRDESVNVLLERSAAQVSESAGHALSVAGLLAFVPFTVEPVAAALDCNARACRTALGELVEYGLLTREGAAYTVSHALVHAYARNLATADMLNRLAAFYTKLAREQSAQGLDGYARLDGERAHILRLLECCKEQEHWPPISALVRAISKYLDIRGYWTERWNALDINLKAARQSEYRKDEGWCLGELGYLETKHGVDVPGTESGDSARDRRPGRGRRDAE